MTVNELSDFLQHLEVLGYGDTDIEVVSYDHEDDVYVSQPLKSITIDLDSCVSLAG